MSELVGSVLNPFAAGTDSPVPTDTPASWTLLACARREFFNEPKPTLAVETTAATLTSQTTATPAVTPPSLLKSLISPFATAFFDVFDAAFAFVAGLLCFLRGAPSR